jgi:ferric-dicitrate binding protein FerR (iron transport regulator)
VRYHLRLEPGNVVIGHEQAEWMSSLYVLHADAATAETVAHEFASRHEYEEPATEDEELEALAAMLEPEAPVLTPTPRGRRSGLRLAGAAVLALALVGALAIVLDRGGLALAGLDSLVWLLAVVGAVLLAASFRRPAPPGVAAPGARS